MQIQEVFDRRRFVFLDGGMGTQLQQRGLQPGQKPELAALEMPDVLTAIHRDYAAAGADILLANTFGANAKKLAGCGHSVEEVVSASIACARRAGQETNALVALDIGPLGELLAPAGTLAFEDAYEEFAQVIRAGAAAGADLVFLETMTDLYELKAAILAAKENCSLPVFTSMSFESRGRTFTGCTVESYAVTAAGLGADAIGINCSLGPAEILPFAQRLCRSVPAGLPVFVKPNAGLPNPDGSYNLDAAGFAAQMQEYASTGISMVGGCCGTTPAYIAKLKETFSPLTPAQKIPLCRSCLCTPVRFVDVTGITVVGERINPTGKKRLQQALREGDSSYPCAQAVAQAEAGAEVLDVNAGLPGIDEPATLYGAAVVGRALDEHGIPATAEGRFAIAQRIVKAANAIGIPNEDIYIDCLTLTASAQQEGAAQTLEALTRCKKELGVRTVLGVSNISFGLPCRGYLNTTFLTMAMMAGLDLAIMNPNTPEMMAAVRAYRVLTSQDPQSTDYVAAYADVQIQTSQVSKSAPAAAAQDTAAPGGDALFEAVRRGLKTEARAAAEAALTMRDPLDVVNTSLIPALDVVGDGFEKGTVFLPQLLQAATAAQAAFEAIKAKIAASGQAQGSKGKIVIATVKGDVHDIGKNIVRVILENYGYDVLDLGRDVPPERVVEAVRQTGAKLVGLSALMTTTVPNMQATIEALHAAKLDCKVMVGGAVLTPSYAKDIGADYYCKDAKASADLAKQLLG